MKVSASRRPNGFTLIELLVVLLIIGLVSAATLPTILPALAHRQVSESAHILQASIEGARDAAIRANAPRGIRLLINPAFPGSTTTPNLPLAYNRIMPIEPAPDYNEGRVSVRGTQDIPPAYMGGNALRIEETVTDPNGLPNARTSWAWNVRVGDRIQVGDSGRLYTIVGPMVINYQANPGENPELFVNYGPPGTVPSNPQEAGAEYLFLVNGIDDDRDGYTDEGFDGVDNDGDNTIDDDDEWERENWTGPQTSIPTTNAPYVIKRRPVPTQGAHVIEMPSNVVIDASSWDSTRERSRLPIDSNTLTAEFLVNPNGSILLTTLYSTPASAGTLPFLHFWLTERTDVAEPITPPAGATYTYRLPMPQGTPNYDTSATARYLKGDRRLVTLFTRSGMVVTNEVESFDGDPLNMNQPYYDAQLGTREAR